jgi:hypothetical protein
VLSEELESINSPDRFPGHASRAVLRRKALVNRQGFELIVTQGDRALGHAPFGALAV